MPGCSTIHDYAPTYDEGQHLPSIFFIQEDAPYWHNNCPNRPCQVQKNPLAVSISGYKKIDVICQDRLWTDADKTQQDGVSFTRQNCVPGGKKTTYTTYTGDQKLASPDDDSDTLPPIDPNNIIMTHSKGWTMGHSCGVGDQRCLCCCCLPYLDTRDSAGNLLGSSQVRETKRRPDVFNFLVEKKR